MNITNDNTLKVYVNDKQAGTLTVEANMFTFQYTTFDTPPLSITIPLQSTPYEDAISREYFANLLPEGRSRELITKQLRLPPEDDFELLKAIGRECAGAVSFMPLNEEYEVNHVYETITEEELYKVVKELPSLPTINDENKVRLSLAGAQSKLALYIKDGIYKLSINGSPSTHIIKKPIDEDIYPESIQNESFAMHLAKEIGLNVPHVEMKTIGDLPFYIIERYDRKIDGNNVERFIQEDFCQATKTPATCKYQDAGGPDITECFGIISKHSIDRINDTTQMLKWIAFNVVVGNNDAHAKNISLLHTPEGIRLAPFYDILSTQAYPVVMDSLAMRINNKQKINDLNADDFKQMAKSLSISHKIVGKINAEVAKNAYDSGKKLQEKYRDLYGPSKTIDKIMDIIKRNRSILLSNQLER